jgi:hypothetical protein
MVTEGQSELTGDRLDCVPRSGEQAGQGLDDWYKLHAPTFLKR